MKLYFALSILMLFYVSAKADKNSGSNLAPKLSPELSAELSPECISIRQKLEKNMIILETAASTAEIIQQKDCNFAKKSVNLTRKYSKCLPNEAQANMDNVHKNMRFVSRIICENVNKRILGCFSPENLRQFNKCTNKTLQYMDFIAKQQNKDKVDSENKSQIRKKRFLLQDLFSGIQGNGGIPVLSSLQSSLANLQNSGGFLSGLSGKKSLRSGKEVTSFEHNCCVMQLHADCFLSKVLHTCAEKSDLRLYKAFQTVFSLALRDVVDIACGKIQTLDQCEKFSNDFDVNEDLGFR